MSSDYLIAYIEEIEGEITEVGSNQFLVKFESNSPISAGAVLLIRNSEGDVEEDCNIPYKSLGSGMLSLDKSYYFDGCKVYTLSDQYIYAEGYEEAFLVYEKISNLSTSYSASLTKVLTSTDYDGEDFGWIPASESRICEFKETFKWDVKTKKGAKYLVEKVCQTVSAMMNCDGGEIFIGIDDNTNFIGIDYELTTLYQDDEDLYKRAVQSALIDALGFYAGNLVTFKFLRERDIRLFKISVPVSNKQPIFFQNSQFMTRLDAANGELKGKELFDYLISKFGNN